MASQAESSETSRTKSSGFSSLLSPRVRIWLLTVSLHLLAFFGLYWASARVAESQLLTLASDTAGDRFDEVVREIDLLAAVAPGSEAGMGHLIRGLIDSQSDINLQLLLSPEALAGSAIEASEQFQREVEDFFAGEEGQRVWLDPDRGREHMHGLRRISTGPQCAPCHEPRRTMAVAAMSLDITPLVSRVRYRTRRNLALLIAAWAVLLGAINLLSRRSMKRLSDRLEAQLAAAEAGEPFASPDQEIALHPATARLHQALGGFLKRQRRREVEMENRLEQSDQLASLGLLATGLAQGIKDPLAGVQGALEVLRDDHSESRSVELYDDMLGELSRVDKTLELVLESSRPSPPWLASTDPELLIKETVALLEPGFQRRDISLVYEIAPETGEPRLDPAKIRQVLIHLIQNAAEEMVKGGKIIVRAGPFPKAEGGIILTVEDDGPGIPEESLSKIFEPFFSTKFSAPGLGLALARRLVVQHGGSLEVDSIPGKGTTFYILLPPAPAEVENSEPEAEPG